MLTRRAGGSGRALRHAFFFGPYGLAFVLAFFCGKAAAQPYTGPVVARAVDQSLDIMKDHVTFLSLQDRYDAALAYFAFTHRMAPLRIVFNDGTSAANVGHRVTFMEGVGLGSPSEFSGFVGAWNDLVAIGPSEGNRLSFQGIVFGGVGLFGFQGTYSYFVGERLGGRDVFGNFTQDASASTSRGAGLTEDGSKSRDVFTLYQGSGASLVLLRAQKLSGETVLSDVRAQFQPLKDWLRKWLNQRIGLPMVAVQKLRDNIRAATEAKPNPSLVGPSQGVGRPETQTYEFELGGDDLLGIGLRLHATTELSPKFRFARAEAGFYRDLGKGPGSVTLAMRAFAYARSNSIEASIDTFARMVILPVGEGRIGFPIHAALSYSYNSPDSATFLPLPRAHVFGYQLIVGLPDIARPLVPIIRPKESGPGGPPANGAIEPIDPPGAPGKKQGAQ